MSDDMPTIIIDGVLEFEQDSERGTSVEQDNTVTVNVQSAADALVFAKTRLNSDMKIICSEIDSMYKISTEIGKDSRRLEKEVDALPAIEDWVVIRVSTIDQLKSQIMFLHKIMEEE